MKKWASKEGRCGLFGFLNAIVQFFFLLSLFLYLSLHLFQFHWDTHIRLLLQRHRWSDDQKSLSRTYYERHCTLADFSTKDPLDLILPYDWEPYTVVESLLTHGISVLPGLVDRHVADDFRNFTLSRNARLEKDEMVYVMNSFNRRGQTRWAFAFSPEDHPAVPPLLEQVGKNKRLRQTLELFLGSDPAIIKMQTITASYGAESQGWHPDVNAKASVLSHARDFLMHFSLFIPLQDTSPLMGATGVCPGTQYCSSVDDDAFDRGCHQIVSGKSPDGFPVWWAGDAVLMNQNTWHRGWAHTLRNGDDRAMVVITFTSRPSITNETHKTRPASTLFPHRKLYASARNEFEEATRKVPEIESRSDTGYVDTRVLSLGTPLSSFGYTMEDLVDPTVRMSARLALPRYLGLYKPSQCNWGWDYVSSVFGRIAHETHKFKRQDLIEWLGQRKRGKFWSKFVTRNLLFEGVPHSDQDRGVWDLWLTASLSKSVNFFQTFAVVSMLILVSLMFLSQDVSRSRLVPRLVISFLIIFVGIGGLHWKIRSSSLIRDIQSGRKLRPSFPNITAPYPVETISLIPLTGHRRMMHGHHVTIADPTRQDVLVGSRFASRHLGAFNRFLDYHSGNRHWLNHIRDIIPRAHAPACDSEIHCKGYTSSSARLQGPYLNRLVDQIVNKVPGNFLLQSPEQGVFVQLSQEDAKRITRRRIMTESSPLLNLMEESVSYMISTLRFESTIRGSVLTSISIGVLEQLRESVFGESMKEADINRKPFLRKNVAVHKKLTGFQNSGRSKFHGRFYLSPTVPKFPYRTTLLSWNQGGFDDPIYLDPSIMHHSNSRNGKRKVDGKRIVHYLSKSKRKRR